VPSSLGGKKGDNMSIRAIIFFVILVGLAIFFIIARKKKWIGPAGGIFTGQVIMHDYANKDKQHAMEYVIENKEDILKEEDESGEGPEGGKHAGES